MFDITREIHTKSKEDMFRMLAINFSCISAAPGALDDFDLVCSSVEAKDIITGDHHLLVSRVAQEDIKARGDQHAWLPTLSRAQRQPHKFKKNMLCSSNVSSSNENH